MKVKQPLGEGGDLPHSAPFDALRASYREKLPAKLEELAAALRETRSGAPPTRAQRLAHTLKGTAGSYGFAEIAASLDLIEEILRHGLEDKRAGEPGQWAKIDDALARAWASLDAPPPPL